MMPEWPECLIERSNTCGGLVAGVLGAGRLRGIWSVFRGFRGLRGFTGGTAAGLNALTTEGFGGNGRKRQAATL